MPTHHFEGQKCQKIHDVSFVWGEFKTPIKCPCKQKGCKADWIVLPRHLRAVNQQLSGVVYFKNKAGKIQIAGSSADPTPKGYDRCEANTLNEIRGLERFLNQEQKDIRTKFVEREQEQSEATISQNRSDLRALMNGFSEKGRLFAKEMMRRNDTRQNIYDKKVEPGVHFHILHNDEGKSR